MFDIVNNTNSVNSGTDTDNLSVIYHDLLESCGQFPNPKSYQGANT